MSSISAQDNWRLDDRTFVSDTTVKTRVKRYFYVIYALIMHDIKNRFFGSGLGQIVMVLWPFAHILVLITVSIVTHRPNPYGSSLLQYSAVSIFPYICFSYPMRWTVFSAMTNRAFLNYPIIKPLDIILARALLEIVSITLVGVLLVILLIVCGSDPVPVDGAQAVYAICSTIFLAVGFGVPNAVITFIFPLWNLIVTLVVILAWASSGTLFVVSTMPEQIRVPLSYIPTLHCVEWMRTAYYSDYPTTVLDRAYVLEFGLVSLTIGLIMERLLRKYLI